jgi:hypothetical protein
VTAYIGEIKRTVPAVNASNDAAFGWTGVRLQDAVDALFLDVPIKHKPLTRDERNVQQAPLTFESLARNALNQGMTLEHRAPYAWEIFSLPHQFGAGPR